PANAMYHDPAVPSDPHVLALGRRGDGFDPVAPAQPQERPLLPRFRMRSLDPQERTLLLGVIDHAVGAGSLGPYLTARSRVEQLGSLPHPAALALADDP